MLPPAASGFSVPVWRDSFISLPKHEIRRTPKPKNSIKFIFGFSSLARVHLRFAYYRSQTV